MPSYWEEQDAEAAKRTASRVPAEVLPTTRTGTRSLQATPVMPARGNPFPQGSYQWRQREGANARAAGPAAYRAYRNAQAGETSDVGPGDGGRAARRGYAPGTTTYDREAAAFIGAPAGSTIGQVHDFTRAANAARMFDPVQAERARLSAATGRSIEDIIRNGVRPTAQPTISSSIGPAGAIRPPSTGSGGLMQIPGEFGEEVRDIETIRAEGYQNDAERAFFLNSLYAAASPQAQAAGTWASPDARAWLAAYTPTGGGMAAPAPAPSVPPPARVQATPQIGSVGPAGRTFAQITGTPYRSEEERAWYQSQVSSPPSFSGGNLRDTAMQAAEWAGIPVDVFMNMIGAENNWQTSGTSTAGAQGIAQLMPGTAASLGVDPNDPTAALAGAARYVQQNLQYFHGDIRKAVAAYNAGPGGVDRAVRAGGANWEAFLPAETKTYLQKVFR